MLFKPITTEKAVKLIDLDNTLTFETDRSASKDEIKKEVESLFSVKVEKIRTSIKSNAKRVYVKLAKSHKAADVATKLGII